MSRSEVHQCECPHCQQEMSHPDQEVHRQMNLLLSRLDEQQRRGSRGGGVQPHWRRGKSAARPNHGPGRARRSSGDEKNWPGSLRSGQSSESGCPVVVGPRRKKDPALESTLDTLVQPETAGDPRSEQKWVRSSLRHLAQRLEDVGHPVSPPTVGRLLRKLGYSLRVNVKKQEASAAHPDRQQQFEVIQSQRQVFQAAGWPIISVDTREERVDWQRAKTPGKPGEKRAEAVNVHDFPHDALMRAVPYGIYDVSSTCGSVYVGSSADTPEFAVAALARWWEEEGRQRFPTAKELLILADAGGSNGSRTRSGYRSICKSSSAIAMGSL